MLRLTHTRRFLVFLLLVVGVGSLGSCSSGDAPQDLEVKNPQLVETPNGERSFAGTLVNQEPNTISIAQVEVALYDDSGSLIETVRIDVEDIPARDSVDFSGKIDSSRPFTQAQIQSILVP